MKMKVVLLTILMLVIPSIHLGTNVHAMDTKRTDFPFQSKSTSKSISIFDDRVYINLPRKEYEYWFPSDSSFSCQLGGGEELGVRLYIEEVHHYSTGDLLKDAEMLNSDLDSDKILYTDEQSQNNLDIIYCTYNNVEIPGGHDYLIQSAVIRMPDNTLMFAYIIADEYTNANNLLEMSNNIFKTLKAGDRQLDTESRIVECDHLEVLSPQGYVFTYSFGPDFVVYRFKKLTVLGEAGSSMGLYSGRFTSVHSNGDEYKQKDIIIGQEIEWIYAKPKEDSESKYRFVETLVKQQFGENAKNYHLFNFFINYTDDYDRKVLQATARSSFDTTSLPEETPNPSTE